MLDKKIVNCPQCEHENQEGNVTCLKCLSPLPQYDLRVGESKEVNQFYDKEIDFIEKVIKEKVEEISGVKLDITVKDVKPEATKPRGAAHYARFSLKQHDELQIADEIFYKCFDLRKYFKGHSEYPTIYCETLEEYFEPYTDFLDVSESSKEEIIEYLVNAARITAGETNGGGEFGVNWPSLGCYINGWLFAYKNEESPIEVLKNPYIFPFILATVAHEKYGHGFITEFTASGKEKKDIQIKRKFISSNFEFKKADTPEETLLTEKWNILLQSSIYVEEGWSVWIEDYMVGALEDELGKDMDFHKVKKGYNADYVLKILKQIENSAPYDESKVASEMIKDLEYFLKSAQPDSEFLHNFNLLLESIEGVIGERFAGITGQYPRYVIGKVIMDKASLSLGAKCIPYAVAIACSVAYNLEKISNTDLARVISMQPKMNINTRMLMLATLQLHNKGDVEELLQLAKEELNFAANFSNE